MAIANQCIYLLMSSISIVVVVQCTDNNARVMMSNSADVPVADVPVGGHGRVKRGISGSQLSYAERVEYLNKHNDFRKAVNPTASDMQFMKWHEELAKMAQEWADGCIWDHGQPARDPKPFLNIGQNLYIASGKAVTGTSVTTAWHDEVGDYTYSSNTCGASKTCGHYTQVVWANSISLGCALADCASLTGTSITNAKFVVCNYGPAGNYDLVKPYKQGTTCTSCPAGSTCQSSICTPDPKCGSKTCLNGGTLDSSCECNCVPGFDDPTCSTGGGSGGGGDDGGDGGDSDGNGGAGNVAGHITMYMIVCSLILTVALKTN